MLSGVIDFLSDLVSYINPFSENFFVYKLIELLGDLLQFLFVPSEESINSLVNSVKDKFRFIDTIVNTVSVIKDMFSNNENLPKMTLTLPENKWVNGQIVVIDLSWYAPYKQYGDTIISAFIYIFFIWRIYIKLSGLISGASGGIDTIVSINNEKGGDK